MLVPHDSIESLETNLYPELMHDNIQGVYGSTIDVDCEVADVESELILLSKRSL